MFSYIIILKTMKAKQFITIEELMLLQKFLDIDAKMDVAETLKRFKAAWEINAGLTVRMLFYLRDCRGGKGLRRQFYWIVKYMSRHHPQELVGCLKYFPRFGCWKDLWELMETPVQQEMIDMYIAALVLDKKRMEQDLPVSFAAKWFPTEGGAKDKQSDVVYAFSLAMNLAPSHIRKCFITPLRKHIGVCEAKMSNGEWTSIDYHNHQNGANFKYRRCFQKRDPERFGRWKLRRSVHPGHRNVDVLGFQTDPRYQIAFCS